MMKKIIAIIGLIFILISCSSEEENIAGNTSNGEIVEKNIIALGDSVTAGYNLDLSDGYPAQLEEILKSNGYTYKITNAGVSGDTSKNLLDRISLYDDVDADIYILTIGANDGLRRQSVPEMTTNISSIIDHLQENNPDAKIVLAGMEMPINLGWNYSKEFNKSYGILADTYDLPLYDFFLEDVAKQADLNLSDGIHPNKEGYAIIADNLYKFLKKEDIINK